MELRRVALRPREWQPRGVLRGWRRVQYGVVVAIWAVVVINFWRFWLDQEVTGAPIYFAIVTLALLYETTVLPSTYLFFLGQMRRPPPAGVQQGLRVALISLCVPSKESTAIIERQLRALAAVTYPHDSWLLDEEGDPYVRQLCRRYDVRHFSRKGVERWNQAEPPFQAKTKAGNVNAWLFTYGKDYEFFVQFDIDHRPIPAYLDLVLGHFRDPAVAWVQAPSVYGNLDNWTARGSAEQELVLQGPLQMGFYGFSAIPFIIGSHSTYRTSALLAINGMQPTRAEDHLDTVVLAQHGYTGVFLPQVIATGDGPETFDTYLGQQFAWAYSMLQVLMHYARNYVRQYTPRSALQFLFVQTWYMNWALAMFALFFMPIWLVITDQTMATISLGTFLLFYAPLLLGALGIWWWSSRWFNPPGVRLTWRGIVLHIARWPVVLWALVNVVLRVKRPYMITPKGRSTAEARPFNLAAHWPYLILIALSLLATWSYLLLRPTGPAQGYLLFTIENALLMTLVFVIALSQDIAALWRDGVGHLRALRLRAGPLLLGLSLVALLALTMVRSFPLIATAATWSPDSARRASGTVVATPAAVGTSGAPIAASPGGAIAPTMPTAAPPSLAATATPMPIDPALAIAARQQFLATLDADRVFGAYDPRAQLLDPTFRVEMIYTNFYPQVAAELDPQLRAIRAAGRVPLLTVEPWPLTYLGYRESTLLRDISAGRYDEHLHTLAATLRTIEGPILIRVMHEMDIPGLYAWSGQPPAEYIAAYEHIHALLRREALGNLIWIWSPAGNPGCTEYYPGSAYADLIAFTALSSQAFNQSGAVGRPETFVEVAAEKYARLATLGKPLLVSEAGISGETDQQDAWLRGMFAALDNYPDLRGVIYYNDYNAINALVPVPPDYAITTRRWQEARRAAGQP